MYLSAGRIAIFFSAAILAFVVASIGWLALPSKDLLAALWKFSFLAAACATIGYQVRAKYSDLIEHPSLSQSEFRRLESIVTQRRKHITSFVLFGFLVALALGASQLFVHIPSIAPWYFKLAVSFLVIEVIAFVFVLLSFKEIEDFKTMLENRKRTAEEKKRLLDKLNGNET